MNKTELAAAVSEKTGLTRKDAERAVNVLLDTVAQELKNGNKVQLTGFGTFEVKDREDRVGRNPKTGEAVHIPATRMPVFKASKALKDKVTE